MKKFNVQDDYQVFNTYLAIHIVIHSLPSLQEKICLKVLISINMYKLNEIHDNMIIDK